jgi:4-hydroxy-3-methylbut-2-en-1-yl diphosphate reductase
MKVLLASPRGFCAGVVRAIDIVDIALQRFPAPIYVRKEIVHNKSVVEDFRARGVVFIDHLDEAPAGSLVIFSAHGVSPEVRERARARNLRVIDATCPLVTKVHLEVHRFLREGYSLLLIGHSKHDEVVGTMGEAPGKITLVETVQDVAKVSVPDPARVMILTQTTLSLDETRDIMAAIRRKFPKAQTPPKDDICYATQNRSNSQRLVDVALQSGCRAHLIDHADEIRPEWLAGARSVGVSAGASAPEHLVQGVLKRLGESHAGAVEQVLVREENVHFSLPKELA